MAEKSGNASNVSEDPRKSANVFTMLENNPEVMTNLAHRLGASTQLRFYDIYSLTEPELLALIPRPVYALLATIPMTESWRANRDKEDHETPWYQGAGPAEPVIWFKQTIVHGCGLIGLLHCLCNGAPSRMITPGSELAKLISKATPLRMKERADLLGEIDSLYELSEAAAVKGDSKVIKDDGRMGNHYVALVQGNDGALWELEGSRKGPLNRSHLGEGQDALSDRALEFGIRRLVRLQQGTDDSARFSCIALALSPG
ncbi:hypothetical protein MBLNU457_6159t1 [Dothideomycetes sp. NU457]